MEWTTQSDQKNNVNLEPNQLQSFNIQSIFEILFETIYVVQVILVIL